MGFPESHTSAAYDPVRGRKRVVIACAMMEDEVRAALDRCGADYPIKWIDRGYHEKPEVLRAKLQESIFAAEDEGYDEIALAFGLCGNGAVGLETRRAKLAIPRFDDCVNMMLCPRNRQKRGYAQAGIMYLTRGWASDANLITGQRERYVQKYGERHADMIMKGMYGAYRAVALIDNGCYELDDVKDYARECADLIGVGVRVDPGSNIVLEKLMSGAWDDDFIIMHPGEALSQDDFDFKGK